MPATAESHAVIDRDAQLECYMTALGHTAALLIPRVGSRIRRLPGSNQARLRVSKVINHTEAV